jgi:hypothetical protein
MDTARSSGEAPHSSANRNLSSESVATDSAGQDPSAHPSSARLRYFAFHQFERPPALRTSAAIIFFIWSLLWKL